MLKVVFLTLDLRFVKATLVGHHEVRRLASSEITWTKSWEICDLMKRVLSLRVNQILNGKH